MNLNLNRQVVKAYRSPSQKIRILTETWVNSYIFCPSCGTDIESYPNNKPVADFYCPKCSEDFELKSKKDIPEELEKQIREAIDRFREKFSAE